MPCTLPETGYSRHSEWLSRAAQLPEAGVVSMKTDALMDPQRSDPRFQEMERQLKFPN